MVAEGDGDALLVDGLGLGLRVLGCGSELPEHAVRPATVTRPASTAVPPRSAVPVRMAREHIHASRTLPFANPQAP